jgi:hypothetical protein
MVRTFITNTKMDIIAETVLSKANIPTTWQGQVQKVDIDSLIEFEYGLEIMWENIDHFAQDGIVLAAIIPKRKIIYMNETKKDVFRKNGDYEFF